MKVHATIHLVQYHACIQQIYVYTRSCILYKFCKLTIKSPAATSILSVNLGNFEERGSSGPTQNGSNFIAATS